MRRDLKRELRWLLDEKYSGLPTPAAIRRLAKDVKRLKRGEHAAYVIGFAPFLGVRVDLSEKPLIPRPETEFWVEKFIGSLLTTRYSLPLRILDVFCGSGCIGLAVLKYVPSAHVTFADIEPRYFKGIRRSARQNHIATKRFRTQHSNILENVGMLRYDYILANPPYIPSGRKLPTALRQEPENALFGGKDGLRYIRRLLKQAPRHLASNGKLVVEFDSRQKPAIAALAKQASYDAAFHRDQYGKWRYAILSLRF